MPQFTAYQSSRAHRCQAGCGDPSPAPRAAAGETRLCAWPHRPPAAALRVPWHRCAARRRAGLITRIAVHGVTAFIIGADAELALGCSCNTIVQQRRCKLLDRLCQAQTCCGCCCEVCVAEGDQQLRVQHGPPARSAFQHRQDAALQCHHGVYTLQALHAAKAFSCGLS